MKVSLFSLPRLLAGLIALVLLPVLAHAQVTLTLPNGKVNAAYSYQVPWSGSTPTGYAATGLPQGLAINNTTGVISGTPTTAGTYSSTTTNPVTVTVTVTVNGLLTQNVAQIVLTIDPASGTPVVTSTAASGTVGVAFTTYNVTANPGATSFNVSGLPPGLTLNNAGTSTPTITGMPTKAGSYPVSISGNNGTGTGATSTVTFTIAPAVGTPVITSAATASGVTTSAFSYQVTATNTPTSFAASGLPSGLTINPTTGAITGTPTANGNYPVTLTASNASGDSSAFTLRIKVGTFSAITSAATATGTVGSSFSFQLTASNSPLSFNVSTPPAGLSFTSAGLISGTPTAAGTTSVVVSANNASGAGDSTTLVITINPASSGGGGGGGGGGFFTLPPVISSVTGTQTATEGSSATFTAVASGTSISYQWFKDGTAISGATAATYTISSVKIADTGSYTVTVTNSAGSVTGSAVKLTVMALVTAPVITSGPASGTATVGNSVTFNTTATGSGTLSYQWNKEGKAISGATSASFTLNSAQLSDSGSYTVTVSNAGGSVTSSAATLTVTAHAVAGEYFGSLGNNAGTFALYIRSDGSGVFLAYLRASKLALFSRDVHLDASGHFTVGALINGVSASAAATPVRSADLVTPEATTTGYTIDGTIASDGTLSGSISGAATASFSAPAAPASGSTANVAGFYQSGANAGSALSYTIIGANGTAYVVVVANGTADAGTGTIDGSGALAVTTENAATITAAAAGQNGVLSETVKPATGSTTTLVGANNDARTTNERLVNISTRGQVAGTAAMTAGFVITGSQPKTVLVRAVGPTLGTTFGLPGSLSAARLEVFKGSTSIAVGTDWGAATNAAAVADTAARTGAFPLATGSKDAALVLTLTPGNYTATATGQNGAAGVALIEVYDATSGTVPLDQRLVNVSTLAQAGSAEKTLTGGFVITGSVPKRMLIRGVGPSLTQFGVGGVLAHPQIQVYSSTGVIASNNGWTTSPDAAAITAAATQTGAFAFTAGSADSALLINLAPGNYTVSVSGQGTETGTALVEVYELPQ